MYVPAHFRENDIEQLHGVMRAAPFATIVSTGPEGLVATHVPVMFDAHVGEQGSLFCHVARANGHWRFAADSQALVIFNGPDAYIAPTWYVTRDESGDVVPTWNYVAVHAYGTPRVFEAREELLTLVTRLTDAHEAHRERRWSVSDAPAEYIDRMLGAIVGLEIPIARIIGKKKLSQNLPAADRAGVIAGLMRESGT
jgi:transcriptional regulator